MRTVSLTSLSGKQLSLELEDRMYIDGSFMEGKRTFSTEHPVTGATLADVPVASTEQVAKAVEAADRASDKWMKLSMIERRRRIEAFADLCEEHRDALTLLDVADNGSCISRMQHDASSGAETLRYYAGLGPELKGEMVPTEGNTLDYTVREPHGAVAAVLPFNHPVMFCMQTIATAVVAGNGIVIKPSEHTPLSTLYVTHLLDEADLFPSGLVNVVTGFGEVGAALTEHPEVGHVTFIGHVETGKKVMQGAATHLAQVMLGTGGKNPVIVFPDADVERTAEGATGAMSLQWQGQSCGSGSRLLVHEDIYDKVVGRVAENFEAVRVGDPFDEKTEMGSIISEAQYEKVLSYIKTAKEEDATLLAGGGSIEKYDSGYFVRPTIFEVTPDMAVATDEIFGPVLCTMKWSEYDEVLEIANGTRYGLAASVWTSDLNTAHQTAADLEAGFVWVNQHGSHYLGAPFGGRKQSGMGRKDSLQTLLDHTELKNVNIAFSDR